MSRLLCADDSRLVSLLLFDSKTLIEVGSARALGAQDLLLFHEHVDGNAMIPGAMLSAFHSVARHISNTYGSINSQSETGSLEKEALA